MSRVFVLLTVFAFFEPVMASDKTDAMAVVHKWIDSSNKGDTKAVAGTCADDAVLFDDIPPYEWKGSGACGAWMDSFAAYAKKTDRVFDHANIVKTGAIQISENTAYVPTVINFATKTHDGVVESEKGVWTVLLTKSSGEWKIAGWSWQVLSTAAPIKH